MMHTLVTHRVVAATFIFALAACSSGSDEQPEPTATETRLPVEPDGGIGDGAEPLPNLIGEVPEQFRGIWDAAQGNCDPASDLRLDIRAKVITFYESVAEVTKVSLAPDGAVTLNLAMNGEGENWEQVIRFTLTNNGQTLVPSYPEESSAGTPVPLRKCPS